MIWLIPPTETFPLLGRFLLGHRASRGLLPWATPDSLVGALRADWSRAVSPSLLTPRARGPGLRPFPAARCAPRARRPAPGPPGAPPSSFPARAAQTARPEGRGGEARGDPRNVGGRGRRGAGPGLDSLPGAQLPSQTEGVGGPSISLCEPKRRPRVIKGATRHP